MVTENREISFSRYSGDAKLDVTTGNFAEFVPENRNGFIDSSIETVAKKPRRQFDEENEKRKRDICGRRGRI